MKTNSSISGVGLSILVFGGGYLVSRLMWKYIDQSYIHGIGISHLFLAALFGFCLIWLVVAIVNIKNGKSKKFWIGLAVTNFCFIVYALTYLFIEFNRDSEVRLDEPKQSLTIQRSDSGSVVLNQDGDTLLYHKDDSNIIDRRNQVNYDNLKIKDSGRRVE